jgi:hydroxyacylglutathione hydrolase
MDVFVEKIVNSPINSNCFIIYQANCSSCIIVDPGSKDSFEIIAFITKNNLIPEFVILTHVHFDHVWGVNELKSKYDIKIIGSQLCSTKIVDSKKNMSLFYDQIGFETCPCDITIESIENILFWNDVKIDFISTPGHTDCSISFTISDKIFVGDLIIPGFKTVTKLPGGNKKDLLCSLNAIETLYKERNLKAYPGHGDVFMLDEINLENIL